MFDRGVSTDWDVTPLVAATGSGVGRWTRLFTATGVAFLVLWRVGLLVGLPARSGVDFAVLGFVLHVVFGHAYLLVPAYFGRVHPPSRLPGVHLAFAASGTVLLTASGAAAVSETVGVAGALLWCSGVAVFLGSLAWSVRGAVRDPFADVSNRAERAAVLAVPVPFAYLVVGSYDLLATQTTVPRLLAASPAGVSHLFATGVAALLVFVLGVRLLPRFLGVDPFAVPAIVVLVAGGVGPGLLAVSLWDGWLFRAAAAVEGTAVVVFFAHAVVLFGRSDRRRVGLSGILAGLAAGAVAVVVAGGVAAGWLSAARIEGHVALVLGGFLTVTVAGFLVQFYPPSVAESPDTGDATTRAALAALLAGAAVEASGLAFGIPALTSAGRVLAAAGAVAFAYVLLAVVVALEVR
ncbi:hypothetical protein LPA44_11030 [Halobacterium sp. KA-4]|uniref:hypothetical protein n=1 Tax=Halobacterium sp. KA-4 TaxID=2896367 RepID=UPI001E368F0C|nr:hypothetical protein [Halobacterium sp. KA-4]MCD2200424.1 hypothetical protein [Halobacterium sp. KA-4]